jgi:hypothetical protein
LAGLSFLFIAIDSHLLGHKDSESRAEWQIYLTISKAQPIFADQREAKYNFFPTYTIPPAP